MKPFGNGAGHPYTQSGGGTEQVPVYACVEGCPVRILNEQSGDSKSPKPYTRSVASGNVNAYSPGIGDSEGSVSANYGDTGGASRFFPSFEGQVPPEAPFFYTGKATKKEKNAGLKVKNPWLQLRQDLTEEQMQEAFDKCERLQVAEDGVVDPQYVPKEIRKYFETSDVGGNKHVSVKPLPLMEWLVKLACPKGGIVLDPYAGSGTTCVAARMHGMRYVGIERDSVYHEIASNRLKAVNEEQDVIDEQKSMFELMQQLAAQDDD